MLPSAVATMFTARYGRSGGGSASVRRASATSAGVRVSVSGARRRKSTGVSVFVQTRAGGARPPGTRPMQGNMTQVRLKPLLAAAAALLTLAFPAVAGAKGAD